MHKLSVKGVAFAFGITWGICLVLLGWFSMFGWGYEAMDVAASFYIGYAPTFVGGIIGGIWGFIDGLIGGAIFAWIYNAIAKPKRTAAKKVITKASTPKKVTTRKKTAKKTKRKKK